MSAAALLETLRARGVNGGDLRHAVHEACHALEVDMPTPWSNAAVTRRYARIPRVERFAAEVRARAVEQVVCRRLGHDPGTVEEWALIAMMEAIKFRDTHTNPTRFAEMVRSAMTSPDVLEMADRILALVPASEAA